MLSLRRESGDTLVEVALAMAILGGVIAGAFAISNKAVQIGRDAKLRVQAAQLQQYQAEAIRNRRDNYVATSAEWDSYVLTQINPVKIDSATHERIKSGEIPDPCDTSKAIRRFYLAPTSTHKWQVVRFGLGSDGVNKPGIFRQCVTAFQETANRVRFDIHIFWEGAGGIDNKSKLTTYLANITQIPDAPEDDS